VDKKYFHSKKTLETFERWNHMLKMQIKTKDEIANTLTRYYGYQTSGTSIIIDEKKITLPISKLVGVVRRMTPIECERLQGFPDNWTKGVSDTQRYRQCGNAVTINVVDTIIKKMNKVIK